MIHRSPNFNDRNTAVSLRFVVLHYTGMQTAQAALDNLCDESSHVGAHYLIEENGRTHSLIDESKRAWHAGKSFWKGEHDVNSASIGIELVNPGHTFGYRPFPNPQIEMLIPLVRDILNRYNLDPQTALLGHSDVAPYRKQDPGELFPWETLAKQGLGRWPAPETEDFLVMDDETAIGKLAAIGYDTTDAPATLRAFQRRFVQNCITGELDSETYARINALHRLDASALPYSKEKSAVFTKSTTSAA